MQPIWARTDSWTRDVIAWPRNLGCMGGEVGTLGWRRGAALHLVSHLFWAESQFREDSRQIREWSEESDQDSERIRTCHVRKVRTWRQKWRRDLACLPHAPSHTDGYCCHLLLIDDKTTLKSFENLFRPHCREGQAPPSPSRAVT